MSTISTSTRLIINFFEAYLCERSAYKLFDFKDMIGEWELPNKLRTEVPGNENKIVGHIVKRLQDVVYPKPPAEPLPIFPEFPIRITLIGKPFAGKSTALKQLGSSKKFYIQKNRSRNSEFDTNCI
jgi:hypothetical protein